MWLEVVFKIVLKLSFTGSFVILLVLLARALLRKAPKVYSYILWAVVLFRLLCPVTFTSEFSILPPALVGAEEVVENVQAIEQSGTDEGEIVETYVEEKIVETEDVVDTYTAPVESSASEGVTETYAAQIGFSEIGVAYPTRSYLRIRPMQVVSALWFLGILGLGVYNIITLQRLNKKLGAAVHLKENIYVCDYIETPFVKGILVPKIYLPSGLEQAEMTYIIAHEKHHIKRFDHIVKVVAYVALCVHWFNPLVWVAFVFAGKDMEMSCDEAVMKNVGEDIRAAYSQSLLRLSTGRRIAIAPLAFGEGNVKARIKNVMNYKKPAFWVAMVSVIVCVLMGIGLCSNPEAEEEALLSEEPHQDSVTATVLPTEEPAEDFATEGQMHEVTVWQKMVDYNGDGVEDTISFVMQVDDAYEEFRGVTDGYELLRGPFIGNVECVDGASGDLSVASANISHDRLGNHQLSYAEIEDNHYMITTEIGEQMGDGYYYYEVYCLTTQELVDSYEVHFVTAGDDFRARPTDMYRQEVVPEFQMRLEKWIADAVLIVATDVNERVENGIFVSSPEMTYEASYYYDLVWERMLDEKTRVDNYGVKVNLPEEEEWIQNPQYLLSDYPVAHIKYYDSRVEAPLLLRYGKMEHMDLAYIYDVTFTEDLQTVWYADRGEERVEILCQVSAEASEEGKKTVLVSWSYEDMNYVIFGEIEVDADATVLAETAIYVTKNFVTFVDREERLIPVTESFFETRYYMFDLPEELVGKVSYREFWDGKCVTFYHTATIKNYEYGGILGDVWLKSREEALSALGMNGRYIGEPNGEEVCITTNPTDVQWEIGSPQEEEFLKLAAIFRSKQFSGYVTLKDAEHEAALTKIANLDYDMGYQNIACEGQTLLGFLDGDEQEDELLYSHVRGGELGGIYAGTIVPEIIINGKEYTVTDGLQGIDFALPVTDNVSDYYRLPYGIFDFDENDEYREILLVSDDSTGHLLLYAFRYDAGELMFLGNSGRLLDDSSFMVTSEGKLMVMQENGREITYRIEDNQLVREKNVVGSADWRKEWQTID